MGEIADIIGGGTPSTSNPSYWDGDIDWYAPAEIADQIYANSSQKKITDLGYENSSAKMLPPGTVLFTSRAGIGKTAILTQKGCTNQGFQSIVPHRGELDSYFVFSRTEELKRYGELVGAGSTFVEVSGKQMATMELMMPSTMREQQTIGGFFRHLDNLITLHQRKPYSHIQRRCNMLNEAQRTDKFCEYYAKWITVYKKGAIRQVTMDKYLMTQKWLEKLIPDLKICDLNRIAYQQLLNDYAEYHERQTTMDFHHQLKGAVLDAVDEGLIDRDPTRKAIIKGKAPSAKKIKYLNQFELHTLLASLELKDEVNWDYFILLVAKTGMRFSEALALTPKDFDFYHQTLSISKTWDYKGAGGFQPTKNKSSVRKIQIDWQSVIRFSELVKGLPDNQPIFVDGKVYNSTVNDVLSRHCERCNIPVISIHGLRHTHASLLLFTGVSIASVARRLGHSSMTTTQKTYLHIIQELENKDIDLVMRSLSGLN